MAQRLDLPSIAGLPAQLLGFVRETPLFGVLAGLGALWTVRQEYSLAAAIHVHFLHQSTISQYSSSGSSGSWALVTGASDGIGKGFVEELCQRGFNVVLHGRNEAKLNRLKDDLLKQYPQRELRVLVIDVVKDARDTAKLEHAARSLDDINLRILINNVGGGGMASTAFATLTERTGAEVAGFIDMNATFPTEITLVMLPLLIRQPSALIITIGSGVSDIPLPYLSVYSGSKAYDRAWSQSLGVEMKAEGHSIETLFIMMAVIMALPEWLLQRLGVDMGRKERAREQQRMRKE
ncbi:hypothetical protein LTR56_018554 [Elasticomyces elasticus]|nr:hypothetical protein LTR56_018554 [Elasticomyces elasticus]KAK3660247.1 hypothetical protein LTR22_008072 [Elasticomyces elasticus]KAK4933681.1 hypothetical protein LTR49_000146 [Elasticomyces elasticus]KAK5761628.1 hypothetical protein LTS12_008232 [Elasticomyces elasticus]